MDSGFSAPHGGGKWARVRRQRGRLLAAALALLAVQGARAAAFSIERVSVDSGGAQGNSHSTEPSASADGRYIAFASLAGNLVAGDTNEARDLFVRDRQLGTTERVSVNSGGVQGNGHSYEPAISADGRYVAFYSDATNLVIGDTNGQPDVFVRDRQLGTTERVSVDSSGNQASNYSSTPAISADGRYVAFLSGANNLVAGDTNAQDIFVRDRQLGTTTLVSMSSGGTQPNDECSDPVISGDGRCVAFRTGASNLVAGDTNGVSDIFLRDRQLGTLERVSVSSGGGQGNSHSYEPAISGDGRFVTFQSGATNLVTGDTNGQPDVFVRDRQLGTTERVSVDSGGGQGNHQSFAPAISTDGRYVAFTSFATNLVPSDGNSVVSDVFVRDRQLGVTDLVDVNSSGIQANDYCGNPAISGDGRYVAFQTGANNLVAGDSNGGQDVFAVTNRLFADDSAPPSCRVGQVGSSGGQVYVPITVSDEGSGVARVQLTARSSNVHFEAPLGTPVSGDDLVLNPASSSYTVYAVKNNPALRATVEVRATDAAGNVTLCDPVIANLDIKKGKRLVRTFARLPEHAHYVTLQNGTPGITGARLWVNGRAVGSLSLTDGQVVTLNVHGSMRPGRNNTVRIAVSGPAGAKTVLLIGDASLTATAPLAAAVGNLEFAP